MLYWETSPKCPAIPPDAAPQLGCGTLFGAPTDGTGTPITMASEVAPGPLVVDDARVYFAAGLGLSATGLDGGGIMTVAPGNPFFLVADPTALYWTEPTCITGMCPLQLVGVAKP
jgi:hypothetical protein